MTQTTDPVALLADLSIEDVESRLRALAAQEDALRVVLRSLRARERHRPPSDPDYIIRFRGIAGDESVAPHVRAAIRAALDRYDARRAER